MSVRDVTTLRKEGKLDAALALAKKELAEDANEWTRMSLFWVLRDYVKNVYIPQGETEKAKNSLEQMRLLIPLMIDDSGAGAVAYQNLCKQVLPHADKMKEYAELSKTDPDKAYQDMTSEFGMAADGLDKDLHEDFGWVVYRYMKAHCAQFTSRQTRSLLRDYMLLKNARPSLLHSTVLNFALKFSKDHADFNFYNFFNMWGSENLRNADFSVSHVGETELPSLISRICHAIVESNEKFPVALFADQFKAHKDEVVEHLRQSYFWKLMNMYKTGGIAELLEAFDYYADNYSSLGSSHWHSEILGIANRFMTDDNASRFCTFMRRWGGSELGNLRDEDWKRVQAEDGKEYPSLAVKSAKKFFDAMKANPTLRNTPDMLNWIKQLYAKVIKLEPTDDWSLRNYATICIWMGSVDEAIDLYKSLLVDMGEKFYLWSELAACVQNNSALHIGLLLKAKEAERNEDFLGDIHLLLASSWIAEGQFDEARKELCAYAGHRKEKGWGVSGSYYELSSKIKDVPPATTKLNISEYTQLAEDFVYSKFEWCEFVLTDKFERDGKEYCKFFDASNVTFSVKTNKFRALRRAKVGTVCRFRCRIGEHGNGAPTSGAWKITIIPLVMSLSDCKPWSLFPVKYGVVDYINKEKGLLHVVTQDSRLAFSPNKGKDVQPDTFVNFREYEERRNDNVVLHLADVHQCEREEALSHMPSQVVVVDDVNEQKQLFHIVSGGSSVATVVHFNQTDLRPNIGDYFRVTYCKKKDKEGRLRTKILELTPAGAAESKDLTKTVDGWLVLKYDKILTEICEDSEQLEAFDPQFAFVGGYYVHRNLLQKYGIKKECQVCASVVFCGDDKWKVYSLTVQ